jgi:hypothetical protein
VRLARLRRTVAKRADYHPGEVRKGRVDVDDSRSVRQLGFHAMRGCAKRKHRARELDHELLVLFLRYSCMSITYE